jgi:DNA-binding MarR family transcriptional regulator
VTGRAPAGAAAQEHAGPAEHPRHRLGEVIHQPVRFSIMAALAAATEAEFGFVRDAVEISDSTLSKQVTVLEQAGYVDVRKGYVGKRPRTWLRITPAGRSAFAEHLDTLRQIAGESLAPEPSD